MARGKKAAADAGPVDELWELPEGWSWERLEDVAPVNPPRDFGPAHGDDEVAFLPMASVSELSGKIDSTQRRPVSAVRSGFTRFRTGDVIFAKITPCMENGKLAVIPDLPFGVGAGSTEFHVLEPRRVHPRYLFHWLSQETFRNRAEHNMAGTAGQKRVPTVWLRGSPIPVPPSERVQAAVVSRVDALFTEIEEGEAALGEARASVETYRKSLLKAAVTGELTADWRHQTPPSESGGALLQRILDEYRARWHADPRNARRNYQEPAEPDTEGLPEVPKDWAWTTLGVLAEVSGGLTQNGKRAELATKLPFLRVANVYENRLDLRSVEEIGLKDTELERVRLQKGDLLIVEGNGSIEQIGRSCVWDGSLDPCVHQNHLIKARFPHSGLNWWTQTWLRSPYGRRELENQASSTSGLHTLSISKVESVRVPLPSLVEVDLILQLERNSQHLGIGFAAEQSLSAGLRQSILSAAFRGELTS